MNDENRPPLDRAISCCSCAPRSRARIPRSSRTRSTTPRNICAPKCAANPARNEADTLELIPAATARPRKSPRPIATTEKQVRTALAPPPARAARTAFGRFFGVYGDSRTWTALFYMLLALVTGVFYFTMTVTGLSISAGLASC